MSTENEQEKNKSDEKPIEKKPDKEEIFVGRSLYDSFNYFNHVVSHTSGEEYHNLCKTIEFGMQLLPDPTIKTDRQLIERICEKDSLEKEIIKIEELYNDACDVLEKEVLKESTQHYGWAEPASKSHVSITLSADDGGETIAPREIYRESEEHFKETQYDSHLPALRNIKSRVFHMLTKYEIIPKEKLTFKETMEKTRIENYKKRHGVN